MDRTLLATSTAQLYTRYRRERGEIGWQAALRVGYWMLQYSLGIINAEKVAGQALLEFAGQEAEGLRRTTDLWFDTHVRKHVRQVARETVQRHRSAGDLLAIVTAATDYAARPLARELGIEHVVSSELEVDLGGRLTGRAILPLCYGSGKVERTRRWLAPLGLRLEEAIFYSDSITDLPLLECVGTPVAVCPDRRLRRVAALRGWAVEWW